MSSRALKKKVEALLQGDDLHAVLEELERYPAKDLVHALFACICRESRHLRWFAISSMGATVNRLATQNMEEARIVMRRLLWSLNDESGGIGWGAPETLGEVMAVNQTLAAEYAHMLGSYTQDDGPELCQDGNFLEHPLLQRGLLWGLVRLSTVEKTLLQKIIRPEDMVYYLQSDDPEIQGMAAWLTGTLEFVSLREVVAELSTPSTTFELYQNGNWSMVSVTQLMERALSKLSE